MGRTKGSLNKNTVEESKPIELETPLEDIKKEKSTDQKTPSDIAEDVGEGLKGAKLEDINGLGPVTASKLRDLGVQGVVGLATSRADEIAAQMKVSFTIAKGWISQAIEIVMGKMEVKTADEYDEEQKKDTIFFHTGSENFNKLIAGESEFALSKGGGIPTGAITGLVGRLASGKTQICYDAIMDCLSKGYKAAFIETEPDTFHLDRLKELAILRHKQCNWSNLYVFGSKQIPTPKAQFLQYKLIQRLLEKGENIKLVVVDSMNAKFRAGWSRSEMLPIRTREFGEHFNIIEYLAATYHVAWLMTFQAIAPPRPDQGLAMRVKFEGEYYPVGGDYVLHSVNNWVALDQRKKCLWQATLFDSSHVKRSTCNFILESKGLMDAIE